MGFWNVNKVWVTNPRCLEASKQPGCRDGRASAWPHTTGAVGRSTYGALGVSDGTGILALEKMSKEVEDKHLMIQTFH